MNPESTLLQAVLSYVKATKHLDSYTSNEYKKELAKAVVLMFDLKPLFPDIETMKVELMAAKEHVYDKSAVSEYQTELLDEMEAILINYYSHLGVPHFWASSLSDYESCLIYKAGFALLNGT